MLSGSRISARDLLDPVSVAIANDPDFLAMV